MPETKLNVSVYNFLDYRSFLKAAYEDLNTRNPNISYRYIQRRAGYSPRSNHFWQILSGRAPMSQTATRRYGHALGLNDREIQFLSCLVSMNQARSDRDRNDYFGQLQRFPHFQDQKSNGRIRYEFYSEWHLPALRALVTLKEFREDYAWIGRKLKPPISAAKARKGMEKLLDSGFLKRDAKTGRLIQSEPMIGSTLDRDDGEDVARLAIRNFHRKMIHLAAESIENHAQKDRFIIGNTMAVSRRQAELIRERLGEFMREIETIIAEEDPIEAVYRLNMNLFPLVDMQSLNSRDPKENPKASPTISHKKGAQS